MMQESKAPPMIHFSQYPAAKVPVKLNAVNFEGVFNNLRMFQDQPSPSSKEYTNKSSRGNRNHDGGDMANLIHVSSMNTGIGSKAEESQGYPSLISKTKAMN